MDDTPDSVGNPEGAPEGRALRGRALDRQILALGVPALGALVAEPLFILVDSAMVGHLGTAQLAGLSLSSTVLTTAVGVFVFLAYATTAATARRVGAGDRAGGVSAGIDGMWLALLLGVVTAAGLMAAAPALVSGAPTGVIPHAVDYLRFSAPGLPGMLLVLASTGTLRGLLDTRTPFVVAASGAVTNIGLNALFIYGLGMGVAGSGLGTAVTQTAMAAWLITVVLKRARGYDIDLRPHGSGISASARAGIPLLIRTLTLRGAIVVTIAVATSLGAVTLAAHQVVYAMWGLSAFALDALAIAAQALVGQSLGAGDPAHVRALLRRCLQWGTGAGALIGVAFAAAGWWLAPLFTGDGDVRVAAAVGLAVIGACMPVAGWVFVLDGVLIGAGDGRYLAWAGVATLIVYLPLAWAVYVFAAGGVSGLAWLWLAFGGGFMIARAVTTGVRARGDRWMVLGAGG
ncbi:MATE family efflux transporter [Georgenia halophila]|uniref:MATE family efflux transporter n=1 Tax=Georgenia halophila TaxID=620889 RepID=A0ABP8LB55_9MICO